MPPCPLTPTPPHEPARTRPIGRSRSLFHPYPIPEASPAMRSIAYDDRMRPHPTPYEEPDHDA